MPRGDFAACRRLRKIKTNTAPTPTARPGSKYSHECKVNLCPEKWDTECQANLFQLAALVFGGLKSARSQPIEGLLRIVLHTHTHTHTLPHTQHTLWQDDAPEGKTRHQTIPNTKKLSSTKQLPAPNRMAATSRGTAWLVVRLCL